MKTLTEEDIKYRYITPAIEKAGWLKEQVLLEYYFTKGPILLRGNITERQDETQNHQLSILAENLKQIIRKEATE